MIILSSYKPQTVTYDAGLMNVLSIRDQFIDKENEKNNIFTAEIEINDYAPAARGKS